MRATEWGHKPCRRPEGLVPLLCATQAIAELLERAGRCSPRRPKVPPPFHPPTQRSKCVQAAHLFQKVLQVSTIEPCRLKGAQTKSGLPSGRPDAAHALPALN